MGVPPPSIVRTFGVDVTVKILAFVFIYILGGFHLNLFPEFLFLLFVFSVIDERREE